MESNTNIIEQRLAALETKIDAMNKIIKRLYMVFLVGVILTVLGFIVPLVGLMFVIPQFLSTYTSGLGI